MGGPPPPARFCSVPLYERVESVSFGPGVWSRPLTAFQIYQLAFGMYEVVNEMHLQEPRPKWNFWWGAIPQPTRVCNALFVCNGRKRFCWPGLLSPSPIAVEMYWVAFEMYKVVFEMKLQIPGRKRN